MKNNNKRGNGQGKLGLHNPKFVSLGVFLIEGLREELKSGDLIEAKELKKMSGAETPDEKHSILIAVQHAKHGTGAFRKAGKVLEKTNINGIYRFL
jgi:hypothetical protein